MREKALYYGKMASDTMIRKFLAPDLPPQKEFHYHAGVFLSGMMNLFSECGDERYFEYVKDWVDSIVVDEGVIESFWKGSLDDYMAGILLFPLYERAKDNKYLAALQLLMGNLRNWIKTKEGCFWHKEWLPDEVWLDGLYMVSPLMATYANVFEKPYFANEAVKQAILMYENMQDVNTKLLYHAWDSSKQVEWADKDTGLAPEVWGRAMGWYVVAVLDIMEQLDKNSDDYIRLAKIEREVLEAVYSFQDSDKHLWYQVLDKVDSEGNWLESSCSMLFVYAAAKAVRLGVVDAEYLGNVKKGFDAILDNFTKIDGDDLLLSGVCVGTGVNDYRGYIERPTSTNDLHGMGAFLLMCAELAKIQ